MVSADLVTMLVQIGVQEAPAIIAAVQAARGTVQNVGPILDQDAATIAADQQQLQAEQKDPGAQP